ncbi:MAG: hypothetical protein IPK82_34815 [Polyangiaceae bacterium]|nr:hypothetical protein [Polyangiaceae bacterium]
MAQRYHALKALVDACEKKGTHGPDGEVKQQALNRCNTLLARAWKGLLKEKPPGSEYDAVWSELHEARHLLCTLTDREGLLEIVHDVFRDAAYVPVEVERGAFIGQIAAVEATLLKNQNWEGVRVTLRHLSGRTARSRESMWRRVHRIEDRIYKLRNWLGLAVVVTVGLVSGYMHSWSPWWVWAWSALELVTLIAAGVLGSLVNMVREKDPTDATAVDFHLRKVRTGLRLVIAAAIVLVLFVVVKAGVLQLPVTVDSKVKPALNWMMAFFAGFLDAFVLGQMERVGHRSIGLLGESSPPENVGSAGGKNAGQ